MYTAVDNKEITTTTLLTLLQIVDDYLEYRNDILKYINKKKKTDKTEKLYKTLKNNSVSSSFKNFYKKHDKTINIIKQNNSLEDFTLSFSNNIEIYDYYFNYLKSNKNNIDIIKANIFKIYDLGITKIILDKEKNFLEIENSLSTSCNYNFNFYENMEVIPTYDIKPIKYKTTGSNYLIKINVTGSIDTKNINIVPKNIEVTSLTFDTKILPNELTYENTINLVVKNFCEKEKIIFELKDAIDLDISVYDFIKAYNVLKDKIEKIKSVRNNPKIKNILDNIYDSLVLLDTYNSDFKNTLINSSNSISYKKFETEKQLCLKFRKKRFK